MDAKRTGMELTQAREREKKMKNTGIESFQSSNIKKNTKEKEKNEREINERVKTEREREMERERE